MTGKLIDDLRASKPEFAEAEAAVDLVRRAGDLLEQMRERAGLTQEQLAKKLGMTPGRISQLESGTLRDAPSLKNLARFAAACGETIDIGAPGALAQRAEASQDQFGAILEQVAQLRQEIAMLREDMSAMRPAAMPEETYPWATKGIMPIEPLSPPPPTMHGFLLGNFSDVTLQSCAAATRSVLAAAGYPGADVRAVEPKRGDAMKLMVTVKEPTIKGSGI
jgi:transcriptional regulator with XRE-family HTH domain